MFLLGTFHCKIIVPFSFTMHIILFPPNLILSRNLKWLLEVEQMIISLYVVMPPTARDTLTLKATVSTLTTSPSFKLFQFQVYPSFSKIQLVEREYCPFSLNSGLGDKKSNQHFQNTCPLVFFDSVFIGQMKAGGNITVM